VDAVAEGIDELTTMAQGPITPAPARPIIDSPPTSVKAAPRFTEPARPWRGSQRRHQKVPTM
jgi:hypothetical protein